MLTRLLARSLMVIVPERLKAVVTLQPDSTSPIAVIVDSAWIKSLDVSLSAYDHLNLQGDETRINIPQHELNPSNNGHAIRARDHIDINGNTYLVLAASLKSVRTRWECIVRKVLN